MKEKTSVGIRVNPRVALLFPGELRDPTTWSGTPAGLVRGLDEAGALVIPISVEPRFPLGAAFTYLVSAGRLHRTLRSDLAPARELTRAVARASPELAVVHTLEARRRLRRLEAVDAVVQIGAGYRAAPTAAPLLTFEDMTVLQAVELGYPEWQVLSSRSISARVDRQRRVYEQSAACCLTTRWAAGSVIRDYGVSASKVRVVGVGRNAEPRPRRRDWQTPRFLFVGKGWTGKNGAAVLEAFGRLRAEIPAARLDVVGDHPRIEADGVVGHGILRQGRPSERRRLEELYEAATCFVLPSRFEAAGIVFAEASAAGIPSIGTTAGGCSEIIGDAGRVVDPGDDAALLAAMRELADAETATRLGALAADRAPLFTWRAVAERILAAVPPAAPPAGGRAPSEP